MNPKLSMISVTLATFFVSASAFAQMQAQGQAGTTGQVGMALPGAPPPQATAAPGDSDHDAMIGHLALGYLGRRGMLIGNDPAGADPTATRNLIAPVVGMRYWIDQTLGLDLGLGFYSESGSTEITGTSVDNPNYLAVILHGGVPLSLTSSKHFSFQVVPELNVGIATGGVSVGGIDSDFNGFHLDVGARAGAEIHFGFMGIPQLSLQGSVGLNLAVDNTKSKFNDIAPQSASQNTTTVRTTVGDNPWNIFTSNVAALYYF